MRHFLRILFSTVFTSASVYAVGYLEVRAPGYDFRSAEYSTSHVYVDEDKSGTNPLDQASVFQVVNTVMSGGNISFTVEVEHGYQYTVQSTTDLTDIGSWDDEDEVNAVDYVPGIAETEYTFVDLAPSSLQKF